MSFEAECWARFYFCGAQKHKNHLKGGLLAGAEGLEPSTVGFGDRCSTIRTTLLQWRAL